MGETATQSADYPWNFGLETSVKELLDEYKDRLMAEALRLCADEATAEDLVMRTFEVYLFKREKYDPQRGSLLVWLRTVMRNLRTDSLRRRKADEVVMSPDEIERLIDAQLPAELHEDDERAAMEERALSEAVNALSPKIREAVVLHYFESLSVAEVARQLRVSENSIKNRLFYARKVLTKRLKGKLGKKPFAVLAALLLGVTALFGAYQAGLLGKVEEAEKVDVVGEVNEVEAMGVAEVVEEQKSEPPASSSAQNEKAISNEAIAKFGRDGVPSPSAAGGGTPALPFSQGFAFASNDYQQTTLQQTDESANQEKPTMKLTQTFAAAALAVTAVVVTVEADGITLESVSAKQRYPWNGLVDIDYTVTFGQNETLGVDDNLEVLMVDKAVTPAVTNRANTFLQAPLPLTAGSHRITWNANADGVTNRTDAAEYHLKVVHYTESYMVIDVSGGSTTNVYPVDFLNGAPLNGFTAPEYKGDKIVLRRIHPGSYMAGSPEDEYDRKKNGSEEQHPVAITKPFYIGVFEVTQRQYENVMGSNPSKTRLPYHPVEQTAYNTHVRGSGTIPSGNTFIAKLLAKCRSWNAEKQDYADAVTGFDLPTDFQWEYACRAGTTKAFNLTDDFDNASSEAQKGQLLQLGRFKDNKGTETHAEVGTYLPNAWGLYDMHGNVVELCRDWWHANALEIKPYVDPEWVTTGTYRATRGGSYAHDVNNCRSAVRYELTPSAAADYHGFRLCRNLP